MIVFVQMISTDFDYAIDSLKVKPVPIVSVVDGICALKNSLFVNNVADSAAQRQQHTIFKVVDYVASKDASEL